jgi:signal transduction histidine kinase
MSIIRSGKRLLTEPVGLARVLDKTVERHHLLASTKGISVDLATPFDPDIAITADPWRLRQVMDNLLSNAVKFSPAGGAVRVYAERLDGGWRISVADDGPGIRPEDRARLFQPFTRLSAHGGERSTGLGLAITQRIVEAHGGQIGVDSTHGGGATFWFTLPDEAPFQGNPG